MNKKLALLVDDDYVTNFVVKSTLERMGIFDHVATSENGEQALEMLRLYLQYSIPFPDLVIVDLDMPFMGGFNFIREFKKLNVNKKVEIIVSSISDEPDDLQKAREMGIRHYFIKPWSVDKVISIVSRLPVARTEHNN